MCKYKCVNLKETLTHNEVIFTVSGIYFVQLMQ